jgi:hypothetical protein
MARRFHVLKTLELPARLQLCVDAPTADYVGGRQVELGGALNPKVLMVRAVSRYQSFWVLDRVSGFGFRYRQLWGSRKKEFKRQLLRSFWIRLYKAVAKGVLKRMRRGARWLARRVWRHLRHRLRLPRKREHVRSWIAARHCYVALWLLVSGRVFSVWDFRWLVYFEPDRLASPWLLLMVPFLVLVQIKLALVLLVLCAWSVHDRWIWPIRRYLRNRGTDGRTHLTPELFEELRGVSSLPLGKVGV